MQKIAILAGGDSGEYEVSLASAGVVKKYLDPSLFEPYIIMIRGGEWYNESGEGKRFPVDRNDFSITINNKKIRFDCVFNAIHGTPGEDGRIQGYLELLDIPHTSCNLATSSLTFDKYFCNGFVNKLGVITTPSVLLRAGEEKPLEEIVEQVGIPCFVKPNAGGSSVGITKVLREEQLGEAIKLAFKEDKQVLVEKFIEGTEITCGVIRHQGEILALPITEIVSKTDFFDYDAKYKGMADEITPARISEETARQCQDLSKMLYRELNCKGLLRFDFIFNEKGMYFLEANTVPGLSEASIVPQQAEVAGIPLTRLFTMMIEAVKEK